MSSVKSLRVTSHVGRDLLASATHFKSEAAAIWEYVVNSLQYIEDHVPPRIQVTIKPRAKSIEISDNGRGMAEEDLKSFFTMHGENIDRMKGRPGRGKFGTGKSAAFGIGKLLRVDTVRNGVRNVIELHRDDIEASAGEAIPLNWVVRNEVVDYKNGTTISINEIFLTKLNTFPIIEYIERHLQSFRAKKPEVAVNEHICEYREPKVAEEFTFSPNSSQAEMLGDISLIIKVSMTPLPETEQGVSVSAGMGNLIAIETCGIEKKELGNYLFGEIDVPLLETYDTPIEPYDSTRSMQLNLQHPVAQILIPFIGTKLEEVRKLQVRKLNEARRSEEARRLASEADKIAEVLNQDFSTVMGKLDNIRSSSSRPGNLGAKFGKSSEADTEDGVWVEGISDPGSLPTTAEKPEKDEKPELEPNEKPPREDPLIPREGQANIEGDASVDPVGGNGKKRNKPRGGFSVEYRNLGEDSDRSKYDKTALTILINLDHPILKHVIRGGGVENINFKRLSYEIAFAEYAVAFGYELADQDPDIPADDLLFDVRSTLNRVSTRAASLYAE